MDWTSHVTVHESALPQIIRRRIVEALGRCELDSSLLYFGLRQTLRWVALHHTLAPVHRARVADIYDHAFRRASELCRGDVVHVVSLACGDGTKDARCLQLLRESGRAAIYTPADISLEMVLTAEQTATSALRGLQTTPLLCELAQCSVLPALLKSFDPSGAERLVLFLGTIHNFWPPEILRSVIYPVRSQDHLLIGANLAPAGDYEAALNKILTQYDNAPTHHWFMGALSELDLSADDGRLTFSVAPSEVDPALKRVQADFIFTRGREINIFDEKIRFEKDTKLRVFYSYRFTVDHLRVFLVNSRLSVLQEWIAPNEEEGLFLCRRAS